MGRNCNSITTCGGEGLVCMWGANVRRRSHVECCSDLRKCNARVEERRLIARNDRALYLELVVAVVVLLSPLVVILVTLGGGWDWRFPGCMCEGMLGGMCAGVVCEDILFCMISVLRSRNCTLGGWSVREKRASTWRSLPLWHLLCGAVLQIFGTCTLSTCIMWRPTICR